MAYAVCGGAACTCSFGMTPSVLNVTPEHKVVSSMPLATIMDCVPMKNLMPFGMCSSMGNPQVVAATAAALGVLTPVPCVPVIPAPWTPGSPKVLIGNQPALNQSCKLLCAWGGTIQIENPGVGNIQVG